MGMMALTKGLEVKNTVREVPSSSSQQQRVTTPDELKALGVNDIGEYANRISDPNFGKTNEKMRGAGNSKLDKDAFMKIMLVQMKNQDPTNPLKSHEMAAQLAQFTQLEQLQNINTSIDEMRAEMRPQESFQSLNLIGKMVAGDSSKIIRVKGDRDHDISYQVNGDAARVTIKIFNESGDEVKSVTLNNIRQGAHSWTWNGQDQSGNVLPAGNYRVAIEAFASNDRKLQVKTDFEGVITGVNFTPKGTVLLIGNQSVYLKDIRKISDPSLKNKDQKTSDRITNPLSANSETGHTKNIAAADEPQDKNKSILNQVSLSREMMEKIEKEIKGKDGR